MTKKKEQIGGYKIPDRFSSREKAQIQRIISSGIRSQTPARQIRDNLRAKGLGYRDTNIFSDIARKKATYHPVKIPDSDRIKLVRHSKEGQRKALQWYDKTIEKYRAEYKKDTGKSLPPSKAIKLWDSSKSQSYDKMSDAEIDLAEDIQEIYSQFGETGMGTGYE